MSHKKWTIQSIVLVTLLLLAVVTAQASHREETARLTPDQAIAAALKDAALGLYRPAPSRIVTNPTSRRFFLISLSLHYR